jgi:hypothetical protein
MSNKNKNFIPVAVILVFLFILVGSLFMSLPKSNIDSVEHVRVDSVSVDLRYPNLPDRVWFYHTEKGVFTSNKELCSVGDSIEVQIIKIEKW